MKYRKIATVGLLLLIVCLSACRKQETKEEASRNAYLDAEVLEAGFIAAGTEGRLDMIGIDGTVKRLETNVETDLLSVAADGNRAVAAGEEGTVLLLREDGKISVLSPNVSTALASVCFFDEDCFFGTQNGLILKTGDFKSWERLQLSVEGTITGLAANEERCIAVTDKGETATTTDGVNWTILDYNEYYGDEIFFTNIESCDTTFMACGVDRKGNGRALTTLEGGVWSDRPLLTDEEAEQGVLPEAAIALAWDGEQIYAVRGDGKVLTLPSCTSCNKLQQVGEVPLFAAACDGKNLLFAGQDYQIYIVDTEKARQSRIKSPAALEKQQNGALIVDVRSEEDYESRHIADAVYMDRDRVAEELPRLCADMESEIIFYCYSGKRSQEALETAQALGYMNVYNLGGIDDWSYDFEGKEMCNE